MTRYIMGLDGGGSKTSVVITNAEGKVLGRSCGGTSNYHLIGLENVKALFAAVMQRAADEAGIALAQLSAAVWALAGAGRPADVEKLEAIRRELLPGMPGSVVHDALAALVGGAGARYGVVLISGTGMIAYGEDGAGRTARAGGWGHILDGGSGYGIALGALRAIVAAEDGRDLPTNLDAKMRQTLGVQHSAGLVDWLYAPERQVAEIALLAPQVIRAAEEGDLMASDVILRAADSLAQAVDAVARRLDLWGTPFPLVLSGGLLQNSDFYRRLVVQSVRARVPGAQPRRPKDDAALGAAMLARELLGSPLPGAPAVANNEDSADAWASEARNLLSMNLDLRPSLEVAGLMHLEDARAVAAVRPTLPEIAGAIDAIAARMQKGGRLIYVGAGTSGRLGMLDASECPPTFGTDPEEIRCLIAGGEKALVQAFEGAEDDREAGGRELAALQVSELDCVVGIAASGRTPYVLGALAEARSRGALTVSVICNLPAPLAENADYVIAPLVGPEVLAGSTRLKAGTAQKLVLNMLSTGAMVRLGKTYGNLMVDVAQHNTKLQNRARRIVAQACGVDEPQAAQALANTGGDVRAAIVTLSLGCTPEEAQARLRQAGGDIRTAIQAALGKTGIEHESL